MEIFRYIPLLFFLFIADKYRIEYEALGKILFIYTAIDFLVGVLQTLNVTYIGTISNLYASDFHIQNSLGLSLRAIGLSRGPGDHGAIMVLMFVFFFSSIFYRYGKYNVLGCCLASLSILFSQSQTSFVAMIFAISVIIIYYFFFGRKYQRAKAQKVAVLLGICGVLFVVYFFKDLRYLYTLVELGTNRNSFQLRLEKMDFVHAEIRNNLALFPIGLGKDYWGEFSAAMDNEYLYIYSVYGIIVFIIGILITVLHLFKGLLIDSIYLNKSIYFVIIAGLVIAYPTSFFTEPRVIILLVFLSLLAKSDGRQALAT